MNINEHPDFQINKSEQHCSVCDKVTEFHSGVRLNENDDMPPTYTECQTCGTDHEL